jgi:hypothetical protein
MSVYATIDRTVLTVLQDILHRNGDLHYANQLPSAVTWDHCIGTSKANIIFTRNPTDWVLEDPFTQDQFVCKRARSLYIITTERADPTIAAGLVHLGSVNVVFLTLMGLLEQSRSMPQTRWMQIVPARYVRSLLERVCTLNDRQKAFSLAHLPVITAGSPGAVGLPTGTVIRTNHTIRVVQPELLE